MTYWVPPRLFEGETVFVVGGGPSLRGFRFDRLRGRKVIALKSAGYDCPWADVLWSQEGPNFFDRREHAELISGFAGIVATSVVTAPRRWPRVRLVRAARRFEEGAVRTGKCSGHGGVGLAVAMGARRVVLLGFDMRIVDGVAHYHGRNRPQRDETYAKYRRAFAGWHADAAALGCEIVNATPGSALEEFPLVDLDDELEAA